MSKIYTKKGDNGTSSLYDQRIIPKNHPIFMVLGSLDSLSSFIGIARENLIRTEPKISNYLKKIQLILLNIGSDIATVKDRSKLVLVSQKDIKELEVHIDYMTRLLPPLKEFIIPGDDKSSYIHVCRVFTREAERLLIHTKEYCEKENKVVFATEHDTFVYLNRLSDYFFTLARYISRNEEKRSDVKLENIDPENVY